MAWDIYGERLEPGHCEVHPYVNVEYPCHVCLEERKRQKEIPPRNIDAALHDLSMAIVALKERIEALEKRHSEAEGKQ